MKLCFANHASQVSLRSTLAQTFDFVVGAWGVLWFRLEHLRQLVQDENYTLTASQSDKLYEIAYGPTPEAAYARALITFLTGFYFEPEMPIDLEERSSDEMLLEKQNLGTKAATLGIVPNPASDRINILIPDSDGQYSIRIIDTNGRTVLRTVVIENSSISVDKLDAGIYFVIANYAGTTLRTKLVINH